MGPIPINKPKTTSLKQYRDQTAAKMCTDKDYFGEFFKEFWYLKSEPNDPKFINTKQ